MKRLLIILIIILVAVVVYIGFKAARLTDVVGNVNKSENSIITEDYTYYLISLDNFADEQSAKDFASGIFKKGGAGYVERGDRYNVYASCYLNKADAQKVQSNLLTTGYRPEIVVKKVASRKKYFDSPKNAIEHNLRMIEALDLLIKEIYSLVIELDSSAIDVIATYSELQQICDDYLSSLENYVEVVGTSSKCQTVIEVYSKINARLKGIISESKVAVTLTSGLKNFCIETIFMLEKVVITD